MRLHFDGFYFQPPFYFFSHPLSLCLSLTSLSLSLPSLSVSLILINAFEAQKTVFLSVCILTARAENKTNFGRIT